MGAPEEIPLVTEAAAKRLNERQRVDYREHRERLVEWLRTRGKEPARAEGYASATAYYRALRIDRFYRFVWDREDGYTTAVTPDHADAFLESLLRSDYSRDHQANLLKAVRTAFRWRAHAFGDDEWEPAVTITNDTGTSNPRDYFTLDERTRLRDAVLALGSIPHYTSVTPEERARWKAHLAQRFGTPKSEITKADWKRANGWKYPSLLWTSLDAGLRPVEVARAHTGWVDTENGVLRIPRDESSKNRDNWAVSLTEQTTRGLDRWLAERACYPKYEGTDTLWLTREGNPYRSHALNHLLDRVVDEAGIDPESRSLSWYAIRHSVGTYMAREEGLGAVQAQLRHTDERTSMRYDQAPVEDRRDALDKMG